MAKIIVNVMPKPVLLDPQGKAIAQTLNRLGHSSFADVRVGKTLELAVSDEAVASQTAESLKEEANKIAAELFINQELEYISAITFEEN